MSYDQNPYYYPQNMGLAQVGYLDDPNANYSFDDLVVWQHEDGRVFWATDSGCSCPTPFEDYTTLESLSELTSESWNDFEDDVMRHCWSSYNKGEDPQREEKIELIREIRALLKRPLTLEESYLQPHQTE
jgi:hypothetical protein